MIRAALLTLLLAAPAAAEPMDGAAFRAFSEGWTLHFEDEAGGYFGSEQYFEDGRALWLPQGGQCHRGLWTETDGRICFLYDVGISCWRLFAEGEDGMTAISDDDTGRPPTRLRLLRRDRSPVLCPEGPGV